MYKFGSVCSGIEAAQMAFEPLGFNQLWSSEIAEFPSKVLLHHHPEVPNMGDMTDLPELIKEGKVDAPDVFCGGTPCQAFSLAGWKNGLHDERGQLTMTFIDIADAIDEVRNLNEQGSSIVLWENVEGVLNNKTNAFGNFIAGLSGLSEELKTKKWPKSGYLEGPKRNVAWRVLDAKFFGLPQQRKRLYVVAGGKDFRPDKVLFEIDDKDVLQYHSLKKSKVILSQHKLFSEPVKESEARKTLVFNKGGQKFEVFREYSDCLYAAYGTKWNGNAAAYNGSLYVSQNDRIRRLTPLECERLMGIPDNHTAIHGHKHTPRYQAVGNSWAVPVINWIGNKITALNINDQERDASWKQLITPTLNEKDVKLYLLGNTQQINNGKYLNTSVIPNNPTYGNMHSIIQVEDIPEKLYLSPRACRGILRRKQERNVNMNERLELLLTKIGASEPMLDPVTV